MKNRSIYGLSIFALLLASGISNAQADPTYAVLDANGNVTNIIVCGSFCAGGTVGPGGDRAVLQVTADPQTGENRGGYWQGPGTTTYDSNTGVFTMNSPQPVTNSATETDANGNKISSTVTINSGNSVSFTAQDVSGSTPKLTDLGYRDSTGAIIKVTKEYIQDELAKFKSESMTLAQRMTEGELTDAAKTENKTLILENIVSVVRLLNTWIKGIQEKIK
jgi:hypothetical protein